MVILLSNKGELSNGGSQGAFWIFVLFLFFLFVSSSPFIIATILGTNFFDQNAGLFWITIGFVLLSIFGIAGFEFGGSRFGILIDKRNMLSLSKFQVLIWAVLIFSSYIIIAASRSASDKPYPLDVKIPYTLWLILGINIFSFISSMIIKNDRAQSETLDKAEKIRIQSNLKENQYILGTLVKNREPRASFSDIFRGEEVSNHDLPDIGKIQMFLFTIVVWLAYAISIYQLLIRSPESFNFPELSRGMTAMLVISNVGYLAFKAIPQKNLSPNYASMTPEKGQIKNKMDIFEIGIYAMEIAVVGAIVYAMIAFPIWLKSAV